MESTHKKVVLIVDDVEVNRSVLADILQDEYAIMEACNGLEAIEILKKNDAQISLMLLDIVMPELSGFEVLAMMQRNHWHETVPVVIISAETSTEYIRNGYELGAVDYISRPFDPDIVLQRVRNTILLYSKQMELESLIQDQIYEKEKNNTLMINILSTVVEFRNGESGLHVIRIRIITEILLETIRRHYPEYGIDESEIVLISNAAALHDIGKIAIPMEILNKPGSLTTEEFEIMKTHSEAGETMLNELRFGEEEALVKYAKQICRWHHERWDGRGYPDHLSGDAIPIAAQIVSLADVYDALVSERVYKPAYTHEEAIHMILNNECGVFNPKLLACLLETESYLSDSVKMRSERPEQLFDVKRLSAELIQRKGAAVSDRTLFLLEQERIKYQFLASLSNEVLFEYDYSTDSLIFSDQCLEEFGVPTIIADFRASIDSYNIISVTGKDNLLDHIKQTKPKTPIFQMRQLLRKKDGSLEWYEIIGRTLWSEDASGSIPYSTIGKISNIHKQTLETQKLEEMAHKDSLTGLYNHSIAQKLIEKALMECERGLLILFDLDDFKNVNDCYGHLFGDKLLKHVGKVLENNIRKRDICSRIGGDEFLVFVCDITSNEMIDVYCSILTSAFCQNFNEYDYTVSIGVSLYPDNGTTYEDLFLHADQALYASKHTGKGCLTYYNPKLASVQSALSPIDIQKE